MIPATANVKGVKHDIEVPDCPGGFCCLVHDQGVRVDIPSFVEIGPKQTIACMESMTQKQWEWISTGSLFKHLFHKSYDPNHRGGEQVIPATIEELNEGDFGLIHICGMITMGCEAMFAGKNVFYRNPETYLHPASERCIAPMLKEMMNLCGHGNGTVTATGEDPGPKIEAAAKAADQPLIIVDNKGDTLKWLHCMDPAKQFAKIGDQTYTVADLILEINQDSDVGKQIIDKFVELRDK